MKRNYPLNVSFVLTFVIVLQIYPVKNNSAVVYAISQARNFEKSVKYEQEDIEILHSGLLFKH